MILDIAVWYLSLAIIGFAALPLTVQLFRHLPDKGVALARVVGLALCGLAYWLLVTAGLLHNSRAAVISIITVFGVISWLPWLRDREAMRENWQAIRGHLLLNEGLFLLIFLGITFFVAYRPEISATEKPMEYAFINGILHSDSFPPADPWLAGYGISYYYFGYILAAFVTLFSGLSASITYNLVCATVFALAFVGAFSLLRNMVLSRKGKEGASGVWAGLLGGFLALFMGNLEGLFEVIRSRGLGSEVLFTWLDVKNLTVSGTGTWLPADSWWWWRASRVVHDYNALGQSSEVIDEFPFFSLILGDIHPHVLALPFVMLAFALALNLLLMPAKRIIREEGDKEGGLSMVLTRLFSGVDTGWRWDPWLWGLLLGAFGFMNTWDLPVYLGLFLVVLGVRVGYQVGNWRAWLSTWVVECLAIGSIAIIAYMPFYLSFRSQAGGFAAVDVKTQPQQFMLMFGVFVVALLGYIISLAVPALKDRARCSLKPVVRLIEVLGLLVIGLCLVQGWWTAAIALGLAAAAAAVFFANWREDGVRLDMPDMLALLMTIGGLLLVSSVEFIMLSDSFGTRMNTVFKFYYAGWLLLSCASAWGMYAVASRWKALRMAGRLAMAPWLVVVVVLILSGSVYTVAAAISRTDGFAGTPSLDGTAYVAVYRPDEQAVIDWLNENAPDEAVLVEAVGGSYTEYGWISAATGIPTLLGWTGHELQWRGSYELPAEREAAVELIYTSTDIDAISQTLAEYDVDYVIIGPRERTTYGVSDTTVLRLSQFLSVAYESGDYLVFERP